MGLKGCDNERGLALLLESSTSDAIQPLLCSGMKQQGHKFLDCAAHVFNLDEVELATEATLYGDPVEGVACLLQRHVSEISRSDETAAPSRATNAASDGAPGTSGATETAHLPRDYGRLGPAVVTIDRSTALGQLAYHSGGIVLESLASFSSCRATACVFAGRWQYEVTVQTGGIQQIGWATIRSMESFTVEEGCGDAKDSYAFDGKRVRKWNISCLPYGKAWSPGDVIGSCFDLNTGELSFYRNGVSMGVAYNHIRTMQPDLAYFPAFSLSLAERCELNFGARPFEYPVPGFSPLQLPPLPGRLRLYGYLANCLERLARATLHTTAASAATASSLAVPTPPALTQLDATSAGGAVAVAAVAGTSPSSALSHEEASLLCAALGEHLSPLLPDTYFVCFALLPALLSLHGTAEPHDVAAATAGVRALELGVVPTPLTAALAALLEALGRKAACSPLVPERFPYSGAYPFLALAALVVRDRTGPGRRALLNHASFHALLEAFMTRKSPSADDLRMLVPHVWWPGSRDETASEERLQMSLKALATSISRVEEKQYELLSGVLGERSPLAGPPSTPLVSTSLSSSTLSGPDSHLPCSVEDDALLTFLRYLVQKNRGANRDIQPPGLSDQTVLVSVYFVLLRMLYVLLHADGTFPAGQMFVQASVRGEFEPLNDMARLGGIVSHLSREVDVEARDLVDLLVRGAPRSASSAAASSSSSSFLVPGQDSLPPALLSAMQGSQQLPGVRTQLVKASFMLYALRVGVSVRMARTMTNSLASSLNGLAEVERHIVQADNQADYQAYLQEARNFIREDVISNVRLSNLLKVVFFGGWKMEGQVVQAVWLSHLLLAVAQHRNLLSYVPNVCVEMVLDIVQAVCSKPSTQGDHPPAPQPLSPGFDGIISALMVLLNNKLIANPDIKESLLVAIGGLVEEHLPALESNQEAVRWLVPGLLGTFDSRLWHPVSTILQRLIRPGGFGLDTPVPRGNGEHIFRQLLTLALSPANTDVFGPFLNRLLNTLSWGVTEFTVTVAELHGAGNRSRRHLTEVQQQYRKAAVMFELSAGLMRVLEFVASSHPSAFLDPRHSMNCRRLLEVCAFVLSHFTTGPDARRLNELLAPPQTAELRDMGSTARSAHRMERSMLAEKVDKAALLAPLAGLLVALWTASNHQNAKEPYRETFLDKVVNMSDCRTLEHLTFLTTLNWQEAFPGADVQDGAAKVAALCAAVQQRRGELQEQQAQAHRMGSSHEEESVPDDLLDPITMEIMYDPVVLPDSQVVVDRATIERHLLTSATDPFSRSELRSDMLKPAVEVKAKVDAWCSRQRS